MLSAQLNCGGESSKDRDPNKAGPGIKSAWSMLAYQDLGVKWSSFLYEHLKMEMEAINPSTTVI